MRRAAIEARLLFARVDFAGVLLMNSSVLLLSIYFTHEN
jgi:hypothetical protein